MPFIAQGKTNWKFLSIVIIMAVIVGAGSLWLSTRQKISFLEFKKPEKVELNYKNLLVQMFPEKEFSEVQERKDCFQEKEKLFYCVENVKEDFLTESNQKNILIVVREGTYLTQGEQPHYPHAAGIYHAWLAVFEMKTKKILTEPTSYLADEVEINFYNCKDKTYILFTSSVGGQGLVRAGLELFEFRNKKIDRVWSWNSDVTIAKPEGDKIAIYESKPTPPDFKCPTKCLGEFPSYEEGGKVFPGSAYIYSYDFNWNNNLCRFEKDETADWKTYRDEEYGLGVKYPEDFFYQEPKVAVTDCSAFDVSKECPDAIDAVKIITGYSSIDSNYWCLPMKQGLCDPEKEVEKLSLENVSWCLHTHSEGAAGSIYTEYYYTNVKDNKCFTLRLLVRTASSCKNYAKQEDIDRCEEFKESLPGILNEVLSTFKFIDEFCGTSTYGSCASDSDCVTDGCSDQVCRSKDEEPVVTTCEYKDCYNAQSYGLDCKCVDKKCQWAK